MQTYRATVRVPAPSGNGHIVTWAEIRASSALEARQLLQAQYGKGKVVSVPTLAR